MTIAARDHYAGKADFSRIYNEPDPRSYYRTLGALGYEIPAHGTEVFERLLDHVPAGRTPTVLDVCCSYGVNAALLNHDLTLDDLYARYAAVDGMPSERLRAEDAGWYAQRRREGAAEVIGLDVAPAAIAYATDVGLLDHGVVADLESAPLAAGSGAVDRVGDADLVTVTGGIGYIGARTFDRIVAESGDEPPWIAALSLRWIDFEPIAEQLDTVGLVTEQLDGYCVPQRRFADRDEEEAALGGLADRGLDPAEELEQGAHCAELYLVRPPEAVRDAPIDTLLDDLV